MGGDGDDGDDGDGDGDDDDDENDDDDNGDDGAGRRALTLMPRSMSTGMRGSIVFLYCWSVSRPIQNAPHNII